MLKEPVDETPTICPTCGRDLERHPIMWYWSCFLHGDYIFAEGSWTWKPLQQLDSSKGSV